MTSLTVIDNKNMRGVIAPANTLPKRVLEDMIDLIELSTVKEARKTSARLKTKRTVFASLSTIHRKR